MRILHLISSAGFYGAEAVVANLALGLRRCGCDPFIGSLRQSHQSDNGFEERLRSFGLHVDEIPCRGRLDRRSWRWIADHARSLHVDVIHTHGYKANVYGYAAARSSNIPLLATCHNWTGGSLRGRIYDAIDHLVLRRFKQIAAVSDPVRASLQRFGVPGERIRVISNGIDIRRFDAKPAALSQAVEKGRYVIGFVGRLVPEKGVDLLVRSAPAVLAAHPGTQFMIIGDGPARGDLEKLSKDLGVTSSVRFMGRQTNMEAIYVGLDVVALPSRNEGAPMTVLEAMAASRPVLATRIGGLPGIVLDGETGILVETEDLPAIERALISVLADPARRAEMGARGRRRAEAKFSCESMARQYLDLYETAAAVERVC